MRINTLDEHLTNQIAAGEVVERPASVIKELFENSIDAGATQINIEVSRGGHELIRVVDDGSGIDAQDLWLAIRRHSTSKISSAEDLFAIETLGFRGEALSSIASVSRLKLISRRANAESGFYIHTEGGHATETITPAAHTDGTTIEIRDLFFNTPARRKFLRTPRTEFIQIESIVRRLAMSHFQIAIQLIHNKKTILDLPTAATSTLKERRIATILGDSFLGDALSIDFSAAGMGLSGWIALPTFSRSQPDMQYFYLNGRYVKDKVLSHAVRNAFQDILFHGRHPAYVLYLTCDPKSVDVNVHPTKLEIRLRDSRLVHDFISRGVKDVLEQVRPAQSQPLADKQAEQVVAMRADEVHSTYKNHSPLQQQKPLSFSVKEQMSSYANLHQPDAIMANKPSEAQDTPLQKNFVLGFAIAQLHNIYILSQSETGLVLVDMHAAHERILYEKMKRQFSEHCMQTQPMLIPINLALSPQEMVLWELHHDFLNSLGIVTVASGPGSIIIREMPCLLKGNAIDVLLKDTLADLQSYDSSQRVEDHIKAILGNMACRSAIKANHRLNIPEMNAILRDMEETPNSGFCNHGRPTWVRWNLKELDQFFLRGQ
jgi:DNA mismatch repair protein MutL